MKKKILISLHDVTPFHLTRLQQAEKLMSLWGISKVSYLFIPEYHRQNHQLDKGMQSAFKQWTNEKKNLSIQWLLHGLYHLDIEASPDENNRFSLSFGKRLKKKFLTANEGEFLALTTPEIRRRIREGNSIFTNFFQFNPDIFIAPAWLFNQHLFPILKEHRFRVTEDHSYIYLLQENKRISAPVITWATRTKVRKVVSQIGCSILSRLWSRKDLIRIAIHPFDFDFSSTVKNIEKVIKDELNRRQPILYKELPLLDPPIRNEDSIMDNVKCNKIYEEV
jgi:predicted deacetylase